jgi:hypothetical protein
LLSRPERLIGGAVGAVFGLLTGAAPTRVAYAVAASGTRHRSCAIEEAVRCAAHSLPDALGRLVVFGVCLFALTVAAGVGAVAAWLESNRVAGWSVMAGLLGGMTVWTVGLVLASAR